MRHLPRVLLAVVLVFMTGRRNSGQSVDNAGGGGGRRRVCVSPWTGRSDSVLVVALLVGAQEIGLESSSPQRIAAILVALSLSLGSGPVVSNIMASYYAEA